ncbi:MAG: UDP-N-acetylmuramate--L-alanine ligase [Clostridia bacterium]|nr:UDP-N-acetylmuramate--L-alanine ligase [Clostridia bacterium]
MTEIRELMERVHRIHFIGIGGSGMSPLAEILHAKGYALTGSDNNESDNLTRIRGLGIPVCMGHAAANVAGAELVVYTAAIPADNPELVAAAEAGIPTLERAMLLGWISRQFANTIAVAGTHGKTTTSSMLSQVLLEAGTDPSIFIGGRLPLINANGHAGTNDTMVCEACEFKDHYLEMTPAVSIILNVDADHLDYFGDLNGVIASFSKFAALTTGRVIYNADDPNTVAAVKGVSPDKLVSFGTADGCDWQARNVRTVRGAYGQYDLYCKGEFLHTIELGVPGAHNVLNSLSVAAAASLCGIAPAQIAAGIAAFHGAGRRFEFLGTYGGVTVADDYAHHPTEIAATLEAAKKLEHNRVWAVHQPFTYSRTARHLTEFAQALSAADVAVISDIMGSREVNQWGVHSTQMTDQMENGVYLPTFTEIADYVAARVQPGDLVITMGGGDVYKCARMIIARLKEKDNTKE